MKLTLRNRSFLALVAMFLIFTACDENDETKNGKGSVLILHEGNFQSSNATIGLYDPETKNYTSDVYSDENSQFIGDVLQSGIINNNSFYGVLNGSNYVAVADVGTFSIIDSITDGRIDKPRAIAIKGNTAYLSNWGPFGQDTPLSDSRILVIDLNTQQVTNSIDTEEGLEDVKIVGNKLLATRFYFGNYRGLTIIDTETNQIDTDIEVPEGPEEILVSEEGDVWVVCNSGALAKVDEVAGTVTETLDLEGEILADAAFYNNEIYYLQDSEVKKVNPLNGEITFVFTVLKINLPYAFGVDPATGDIYIGDGVEFGSEGIVYRYDVSGNLQDDFTSGILPTQFIFN